jgi:hypothetical protein
MAVRAQHEQKQPPRYLSFGIRRVHGGEECAAGDEMRAIEFCHRIPTGPRNHE